MSIDVESLGHRGGGVLGSFLAILGDEGVGFPEIAVLASHDPGLAARVLRMANSSYYGLAGMVENLQFACSIIGILGLRTLAIAELSRRCGSYPEELASRCSATAEAAHRLAPAYGVEPLVAMSAGLVAELGRILIAQQDPEGYVAAQLQAGPEEREIFETQRYGETARQVTIRALSAWQFPKDFVAGIEGAGQRDPENRLARVLKAAISELESVPFS